MPSFLDFYYDSKINAITLYYDSYPLRSTADKILFKVKIYDTKINDTYVSGTPHLYRVSCSFDSEDLIKKIIESKYDYMLFINMAKDFSYVLFSKNHNFFEII